MSSNSSAIAQDGAATSDTVAMIRDRYLCRNMMAPPFKKV
jgi:hypothetical protein